MTQAPHSATDSSDGRAIGPLRDSFLRHLAAENRSPSTRTTYGAAVDLLAAFLDGTELEAIRRSDIESFLIDLREREQRPATLANRYRSLQQFFRWLVDEGELTVSPMANMKPPHVPEEPPDVLQPEQLRALLATVEGTGFEARRDMAIVRLFLDTGMRRTELAGLKLADLDLEHGAAVVLGKGKPSPRVPVRAKDGAGDRPLPAGPRPPSAGG